MGSKYWFSGAWLTSFCILASGLQGLEAVADEPESAEAASLLCDAVAAAQFAEVHRWYIKELAETEFVAADPESPVESRREPKISQDTNPFHNKFADSAASLVFRSFRFDSASTAPIDINLLEAMQIMRETTKEVNAEDGTRERVPNEDIYYGKPLVPIGFRRSYQCPDRRELDRVNALYTGDADEKIKPEEVVYVRKWRDIMHGDHTGFAVKRGERWLYLLTD